MTLPQQLLRSARPLDDEVPFHDLGLLHASIRTELQEAFDRVLTSSAFTGGAEVRRFETLLAECIGVPHAVGVASGTAALHLALVAAGIGPGDEVILPPNTFIATAEAVVMANATPVFVDVDPTTALLDPGAVAAAVTPRTAAVVAVHLYGQPADMHELRLLCERHKLFILEDAAQAITATWDGRPAGSLGDAAAFSFYPSKNLGALGEGGAVVTTDAGLAHRVSLLRSHGELSKNRHVRVGFNERLHGLQAAFLSVKLRHLHEAQAARLEAAGWYETLLAEVEQAVPLATDDRAGHSRHLMVVQVPRRDAVFGAMRALGIGVGVHYPTPIHLQPAFHQYGGRPGAFPSSEQLAESVLSLPLFTGITPEQVQRTTAALQRALEQTT